ncbi:hypothetical protein Patl1_02584 [Pistacia atlantica]|uniref:Uncharacterized protein n=1 Tax=Pistacia atlantica TaxID=434234 RepID=A0ACC1C9I4_9ROSI|nr:hypothetical protein Patl1_02584 [Pistacia atlantica]
MRDSEVDVDSPVLEEEQMSRLVFLAQLYITTLIRALSVDKNVKFFPLLKYVLLLAVKLEKGAVLRAICAGFEEPTEPTVCLSGEHIQDPLVGVGTFSERGLTLGDDTFRGRDVNAPWLMVCSSNEMATATVKWYHSGLLISPFPGLQVGFLITPFSSMH